MIYYVIRGGSWNYFARFLRSAYRNGNSPGDRNSNVGFRLIRESVGTFTNDRHGKAENALQVARDALIRCKVLSESYEELIEHIDDSLKQIEEILK